MTHVRAPLTFAEAALNDVAAQLRADWDDNAHAIHKRPPFTAHSFDADGRYWVVGSTGVSVLNGAHGPLSWAARWAASLNGVVA